MPVNFMYAHPALVAAGMLAGAAAMIAWRFQETRAPVTARRIVAPPLGMSTGFAMFLAPAARVPWLHAAIAFALGALVFAIPLARTSRLARSGDAIVLQRSKAFLWILLGLVALRFGLRAWIEEVLSPAQTAGLFFILAFGTIARWRVQMLLEYLRLRAEPGVAEPG